MVAGFGDGDVVGVAEGGGLDEGTAGVVDGRVG